MRYAHFIVDDETQKKIDFLTESVSSKARSKVFLWCLNKCFDLYHKNGLNETKKN